MPKLKEYIKFFIFEIIDFFIKPSNNLKAKSILIIRLDAIGDYVLFRNFIKEIKNSNKYKGYSITLLGNIAWKEISKELDSQYVDNFIWVDRNKFNRELIYRYKKLQVITSNSYEIIISPVYSREFYTIDKIVKLIDAKEKIGSKGDCSVIKKWQKKISDKYYTRLIDVKKKTLFEFYRNKEFFENLLDSKLYISRPSIPLGAKNKKPKVQKKYALLFIGASQKNRKWGIENFAKVGNYIKIKYEYDIVLCGISHDNIKAKEFENFYKGKILNFVGKTSLLKLLNIINNADLILSNETSIPHFAVALDKKNIFVIYNGVHFGRFIPYPKKISSNYHFIYHPYINKNLSNYRKISNKPNYQVNLDINDISFKMVRDKIDSVINIKSYSKKKLK